jgi:hypothetical protein
MPFSGVLLGLPLLAIDILAIGRRIEGAFEENLRKKLYESKKTRTTEG